MTQRIYTVSWTQTCPRCEGTGSVQHPAWAAYWIANPTGADEPDALIAARMNAAGFAVNRYGAFYDFPPEGTYCPDCEGEGEFSGTADLRTALLELEEIQL